MLNVPENRVEGEIGYFGLAEWWLSTFTEAERNHIESVYRPFIYTCSVDSLSVQDSEDGGLPTVEVSLSSSFSNEGSEDARPLTQGRPSGHSRDDAAKLLWGIASWFCRAEDQSIALRMLTKAEEIASGSDDVLNLHFIYGEMIQVYYKRREIDQTALNNAISACGKQIALSVRAREAFKKMLHDRPLPRPLGYQQLAIIREKQQDYVEAIRLSRSAMREGWSGDWENRIARCEKKLNKSDTPKKENKSKDLFHEFKK